MYKKKDKFHTIGSEMRLKNIKVDNVEDIYHYETSQNSKTKAKHTHAIGSQQTFKTNTTLCKGRIVEVNSNYTYKVEIEGERRNCFLSGRQKFITRTTRNPICVGDYVNIECSDPQNLRVEEILPRTNALSRYIRDQEVLLAANVDQIVIVASAREPDFNAALIDRYICISEIAKIPVIICINKVDLCGDLSDIITECKYYHNCGYSVVYTSTVAGVGIDDLKAMLLDKESLFTGHSGTGKSSIINALEPSLNLKTKQVSQYTSKGTHTTTYTHMFAWSFGGYLVDTPGIKTLGLSKNDLDKLPKAFPGFERYAKKCEFANCSHTHEVNCAVKNAVGADVPEKRYNSYLSIRVL